ncbi:MAG: SIMPL domain-containing protein [Opitutaceae bacterium]|nr:SIMPL domain-containing protein [Opitutaceae bacterium]
METSSRPHLFGLLAGLFLAGGLAFASLTVAGAWTRIAETQVVNVTGSARKNVRSDLVIWRASFATEDASLLGAHEKLAADLAKVERFLRGRGVAEFTIAPVQFREVTARAKDDDGETVQRRIGYRLIQRLEVSSDDIDGVPRLGTDSSALLGDGIALVSDGLEFIYTKAGEAKVEMMAEATRDARLRAEQIAAQGRRALHELRSARMGVVQINPLHSGSTSWEGNNDRSSLEKTITATVAATFSLR